MMKFWFLGAFTLCYGVIPSQSFSPSAIITTHVVGNSSRKTCVLLKEGKDTEDGGTEWIKNAMGSEEGEDGNSASPPPPTNNDTPDFSKDEIEDMNQLIMTLSKEFNDDTPREKLAEILDKELTNDTSDNSDESADINTEVPRFAQLFQISLDYVGEEVQAAAREVAAQQQQEQENLSLLYDKADDGEEGERVMRVKSQEELQLWALIDMMVQSKTRVKLHMGSLGSKGEFR